MGQTQTKLHWAVLGQDWKRCRRRLEKTQGAEARISNPFGDLPLHLACYEGQAPPDIVRALIDAHPNSVRMENRMGLDPLVLAAKNYRVDHPYRPEILGLLRWHRPGNSPAADGPDAAVVDDSELPGYFSHDPPKQLFSAAALCVVCMEEPAIVAMIPCGHICLCMKCVRTTMKKGRCPVGRCEVQGLYQLKGDQVRIHESMCGCEDSSTATQNKVEVAC